MKIVGQVPSILSGSKATVYRFAPLHRQHVIRCHPKGKGVVFSFYARTLSGSENLRVSLEAPVCSQSRDFQITASWERFEISLGNDITLRPLNIFFTTQIELRKSSDLAIALPQVENALYATSPILPEVQLPAISNDPNTSGSKRKAYPVVPGS